MSDIVYRKLAKVLDTLPNGFPATEDGLEIKILKKVFAPEEAELFCDLRMNFETADRVSQFIENAQSFGLETCVCKKEMRLLDKGCDKPEEVCLGLAPVPGVFENNSWGRPISKDEAYSVLKKAEEAALVHMCANVESGQIYICNCCGCCCGLLRSINQLGITDAINSNYYALIDADECTGCGICAEERCQVNAIKEEGDAFRVIRDNCIGCGLCITECPTEAIRLVSKTADELVPPPRNDDDWFDQRARIRGVDYSRYK